MKQLTMTKVLTPLAALAFAFGVQAATVSDGFETETSTVVTNRTGWSFVYGTDGADDASAITAYGEATKPSKLPDAFATAGDNYLKLSTEDGTLFRSFGDAAAILDSGLYVDTDVQFTVTDSADRPEYSNGDKFIVWLEANGNNTNLCVMAREYSYESSTIAVNGNKVYTLANTSGIVPGQWYRLTVKAIKNANAGGSYAFPGFQIYLNDTLLAANEYAVAGSEDDAVLNGFLGAAGDAGALFAGKTFFPAMTVAGDTALSTLAQVGFSGEGAVDNVVLTQDIPGFAPSVRAILTLPAEVASINIPALGVTGAVNGDTITIAPGASFTLANNNITMASGNVADYDFGWTDLSQVTADGLTITANSVESAVAGALTLTATALNTVDVTINYEGVVSYAQAISYSVNGGESTTVETEYMAPATIVGCGFGTNITVNVEFATGYEDYVAQFAGSSGLSLSSNIATVVSRPSGGEATITITAVAPAAKVNGTSYATFAEAVAAAKNTANAVELADDITLTEALSLDLGDTVVIDLNGYTITGADDAAVFSNAGTLTITDLSQDQDGSVVAGTNGSVVYNTGALSLVYGTYTGTFTNTGTFTITTDCVFSYDLDGAYTPEAGYEVAPTYAESPDYKLSIITYTITYKKGDAEITPALTPATYTVTNNVTLPTATADVGYTFTGWKDASNNDVTSWTAGDKTGDLVLTAQFSQNTYTIKFVYGLNGETTNTQSLAYGATPTAPTTAADVAGYTWAWDTTPVAVVADATYTATYTATSYTITYTLTAESEGSGTAPAAGSYTVNSGTVTLTQPVAVEGYTFSGWYANSGLTGDAVTTFLVDPAALENKTFYGKFTQDASVTPTIDPTDPTTPAEVKAVSAEAAIEAVAIAAPAGVEAADYKALFDFSATEKPGESGTYEVTVTGIKDTVEQAVTVSAAEIVDGTSADNKVAVPAGLYYEITTMESLGGTATVVGRGISDGNGVNVSKPGTTQGFIKVKIGTASFE